MTTSLHIGQKNKTKKHTCVWHTQGWTLESPATRLKRPCWQELCPAHPSRTPGAFHSSGGGGSIVLYWKIKEHFELWHLVSQRWGKVAWAPSKGFFFSLPLPSSSFLINHRDTSSVSTLRRTEGGMYLNPNIYGWRRPRRSDHATFTGEDAKSPLYGATQRKKRRRAGESLACVFNP